MKKILFFIEGIFIISLISILTLVVTGNLSFGYGLGDWYHVISTFIAMVVVMIGFHAERLRNFRPVVAAIMIIGIIIIILKISILRGPEMSWDGHFFIA